VRYIERCSISWKGAVKILKIVFSMLAATLFGLSGSAVAGPVAPDERPNILLIVADDLGYADLGIYGSDISTPNIDALAAEGLLFTQFHTAPSCGPTRAMLLSGNNNHVAGTASQNTTGIRGRPYPGYENYLSNRIVPFPRLLRDAGYHTYMTGKWHLGEAQEHSPKEAGFERSFVNLHGGGNHYNKKGFEPGGSIYREDQDLVQWPEGRYSTDLFTEKLLHYIDSNRQDEKPFFAFASYTSPHWPLQVPDSYLDLYSGRYDAGYDQLREQRFESLKVAGIIPPSSELPPRNDEITLWSDLSPEEQRVESRKMELYAAMVNNLDDHVGRLVGYLKAHDLYDKTLIIFMSDNGAAGEDFYEHPYFQEYLQSTYDNSYENMGQASSFVSYGSPWAEAGSAPFHRYKTYTREGGMTAPMIAAGHGVASQGKKTSVYLTVMDLAPTFLELAGVQHPTGGDIQAMLGESAAAFLGDRAETVHDDTYVTTLFHQNRAFIRQGRWKLSNLEAPFDESDFELFDLQADPGETRNLAEVEPEKYDELVELWRLEREKLGIVLPQDL
jgi:arylsulfatase